MAHWELLVRDGFLQIIGILALIALIGYIIRLHRRLSDLDETLSYKRIFEADFQSSHLGRYYYSFFPSYMQPERSPPQVDEEGIPISDYSKLLIRGVSGLHYNPLTIAHWALGAYDDYLETGDQGHYELFLKRSDWLVKSQVVNENGAGFWYHTADWGKPFKVKAPWASAMAQGMAISALLRAYQETKSAVYLETAAKALKGFEVSIHCGGIKSIDERGNVFYEEVPSIPPPHILNGHIFALFGLHDYYRVTGELRARELFEAGLAAVRNRLPDYDTGFWSRYSLDPNPNLWNHWNIASPIYQRVHIDLLRFLYRITGDPTFARWADHWEAQQRTLVAVLLKIAFVVFKDIVLMSKCFDRLRRSLSRRGNS